MKTRKKKRVQKSSDMRVVIYYLIPPDLRGNKVEVNCFEIQVLTLFQHTWAEAEHDLGYKILILASVEGKKQLLLRL